jgi:Protein of unknown function (DUF1631)
MTPTEPRLHATLQAAMGQLQITLTAVIARVLETVGAASHSSSVRVFERDLLITTHVDLQNSQSSMLRVFMDEVTQRVTTELSPAEQNKRSLALTDWQSLSLVDDSEMEERLFSDRLAQQIAHACENELRELAAYMASLLQMNYALNDRNPLRAEIVGISAYRAIETASKAVESRKLLTREFGVALAAAMPGCYTKILQELRSRGVQPVALTVRQVEGPGNQLPGVSTGYATLSSTRSVPGALEPVQNYPTNFDTSGELGRAFGQAQYGNSSAAKGHSAGAPSQNRPGARSSGAGGRSSQGEAQLMSLLRQLTFGGGRAVGSSDGAASASSRLAGFSAALQADATNMLAADVVGPATGSTGHSLGSGDLSGLMAVNLIRAHREELLQASGGKLDHMIIDVVGSLFDQILSDGRVPPQMARQIARLQLPVLRVALSDSTFFSSRRHPVRRFVNRIASLACAYDDFQENPGKQFLVRVRELVQEIVEGDFDQIELYTAKLATLETFIAEQAHKEVEQHGTATTLSNKEIELRLQQRYMLQLRAALKGVDLPDYLRDFLPQVWSQALVLAVTRDGADSDRAKRYRRVGRDLVMSVQPKGSPILRKKFLMQLPPLMKDLNEGMALVGWPEAAQKEFFAKLLPAHAESLKSPPQSELDHNMMAKQIEAIFNTPVPGADALSASDPLAEIDSDALVQRFSAEEAKKVGLVTESAVDWSRPVAVDIDLNTARRPTAPAGVAPAAQPVDEGPPTVAADLPAPRFVTPPVTATAPAPVVPEIPRIALPVAEKPSQNAVLPPTSPAPFSAPTAAPVASAAAQIPAFPPLPSVPDVPAVTKPALFQVKSAAPQASSVPLVSSAPVTAAAAASVSPPEPPAPEDNVTMPAMLPGIDVDLSLVGPDPTEATRGANLIDNIEIGFAYQMQLKDEWQKVRLAHVSVGRSFFVFTHGKKHNETISMTARMLARMCESGRMRAIESSYLMERATQRARHQLSMLGGGAQPT